MKYLPIKELFNWYDLNGRILPWRLKWPKLLNPYNVLVSEIMLQQTQVNNVISYYEKFIEKWPNIKELSQSNIDDVLALWAGLGYYSRARNLYKTSKIIMSKYDGKFPRDYKTLISLPGIGQYTAGAICTIAYDMPEISIDTNILKILMRYLGEKEKSKFTIQKVNELYKNSIPKTRRSDFPQALMDLSSKVCKIKNPICNLCPFANNCIAKKRNEFNFVKKLKKNIQKQIRTGTIFLLSNKKGEMLLIKRPNNGLFGGMITFPGFGWDNSRSNLKEQLNQIELKKHKKKILHSFSHFNTIITVKSGIINYPITLEKKYFWSKLDPKILPQLMLKCYKIIND